MNKFIIMLGLLLATSQVAAKEESKGIDTKKIYFGGGFGMNDANFGDGATGFQLFLGMPLPIKTETAKLAVEVGYMDSGNFETNATFFNPSTSHKATGLWGTAVASIPMNEDLDLIGRAGLDIGDDDGVMIGAGVGFKMNNDMDLRIEYVMRDTIDSFQFNLVIRQ